MSIEPQISETIPLTTIILRIESTNYLIKMNDFITTFTSNKADAVPCRTLAAADADISRRFINIGKIFKRTIYINKRQLITLFPPETAASTARKQRTYILQQNSDSEIVPGVTAFNDLNACMGPAIKVWDLQVWQNNIPIPARAPAGPATPMTAGGKVTLRYTNKRRYIKKSTIRLKRKKERHIKIGARKTRKTKLKKKRTIKKKRTSYK